MNFLQITETLDLLGLRQHMKSLAVLHKTRAESDEIRALRPDYFSVLITSRGQLELKINSASYKVPKNTVLIVPPGKDLELSIPKDVEYYAVLFSEKYISNSVFFQKHFKLYPFFNHEILSSFRLKNAELYFMISLLRPLDAKLRLNSDKIEDQNICELLFQIFIMQLMAHFNADIQPSSINKNDLVYRFFNLLSINCRYQREVKSYAERLSINPKYLGQILASKTGKTAKELIDDSVIMEAKMLLDNPANSIKAAAEELSFSDQFHFSQFFKRKTGKTPTQYRLESDF